MFFCACLGWGWFWDVWDGFGDVFGWFEDDVGMVWDGLGMVLGFEMVLGWLGLGSGIGFVWFGDVFGIVGNGLEWFGWVWEGNQCTQKLSTRRTQS